MTEAAVERYIAIASDCEQQKLYADALDFYKKGIDLMNNYYPEIVEKNKQIEYQAKINCYLLRARTIQHVLSQIEPLSMQKHIEIKNGDTGKGYDVIFSPYLDCLVRSVKIYEPYLRNLYQFFHLKHLMELMSAKCKNLKEIYVETSPDLTFRNQQDEEFYKIKEHINKLGMKFEVFYSKTIHDRAILLDNGWNIQIGRGIHYFYDGENDWISGDCNLNLKRCRETRIDVYFNSDLYGGVECFNSVLRKPVAGLSRIDNNITSEQCNTITTAVRSLVSASKSGAVVDEHTIKNIPSSKTKVLKRCGTNLKKSVGNHSKAAVNDSISSNAVKKKFKASSPNKKR